jgi:hypothetical protein
VSGELEGDPRAMLIMKCVLVANLRTWKERSEALDEAALARKTLVY